MVGYEGTEPAVIGQVFLTVDIQMCIEELHASLQEGDTLFAVTLAQEYIQLILTNDALEVINFALEGAFSRKIRSMSIKNNESSAMLITTLSYLQSAKIAYLFNLLPLFSRKLHLKIIKKGGDKRHLTFFGSNHDENRAVNLLFLL